MKHRIIGVLGIATLAGSLVTGCYSHRAYEPVVTTSPTGEVLVTQEPPPPRQEVIGVAPTAEHVWVKGYWAFQNRRWVWMPGHWELRPRAGATWVPGHWDHTARGWVWFPGHWD